MMPNLTKPKGKERKVILGVSSALFGTFWCCQKVLMSRDEWSFLKGFKGNTFLQKVFLFRAQADEGTV